MVTSNAVRFPVSLVLALALMAYFFLLLSNLIGQPQVVTKDPVTRVIQFTPQLRDTPVQPPRVVKEQPPVPVPPIALDPIPGPRDSVDPFVVPSERHTLIPPVPWHGVVSANEVPLVRVDPDYPRRLQASGVEGWVQLQFTILGSGAVTDVVVVDADPKGVFDAAAMKAVRQWKYSPRIDEGRAVERRGVSVVVRFDLR